MTANDAINIDPPPPAARSYQYQHGDRPLDGFTIQRGAGRGGFGEVYYALSDSGREVALKLVQTYEQIELRGISQCMNLKSPHLVTIFDVKYGTDGRPSVPYLTSKIVTRCGLLRFMHWLMPRSSICS